MINIWIKSKRNVFSSELAKFLIVGALSAIVNFYGRMLFRFFLPFTVSVLIGYLMGTISSFLLNKNFTFKAFDENPYIQFAKFLAVTPSSILLGVFVASFIVRILLYQTLINVHVNWIESLGHLMAIGVTTIYNYLAIKFFCFRKIVIKKPGS